MSPGQDGRRTIVIAGDVTMDWNFARTRRSAAEHLAFWQSDDRTCASCQPGGAALMADLVKSVAAEMGGGWHVEPPPFPARAVAPGDPSCHHAYALWSPHPYDLSDAGQRRRVWRVAEFLGADAAALATPAGTTDPGLGLEAASHADIVVLDEGCLGFRAASSRWPATLKDDAWVVLKMSRPIADGPLWAHVREHHARRLIAVLRVNDLRLAEVQISRELSWERTAQDIFWELIHNPRVKALAECAHVVVTLDAAGVIVLSRGSEDDESPGGATSHRCRLIFDPHVMEGMWGREHPGGMIGYTSCMVAGIARHLMRDPAGRDIGPGIQAGLAATRWLHREGYSQRGLDPLDGLTMPPSQPDSIMGDEPPEHVRLAFPSASVAQQLALTAREVADGRLPFAQVGIADPTRGLSRDAKAPRRQQRSSSFWTILEDRYTTGLDAVARGIVEQGIDAALQGVPTGRMGNLVTVDRHEIESFRSIRTLIGEHFGPHGEQKPVSIAVFGAPGAGKSFAITEAATSLLGSKVKKLDFNLSQFDGPAQLQDAFHQVRDAVLSGLVPLVFWDEFDTSLGGHPLAWLRHFLAPMQDGVFYSGQVKHPIGRAVFIFAGGTSPTMAHFKMKCDSDVDRLAKGQDFVSRLKGYLDVLGPNPRDESPESDPYFIIRRAILLRGMFQRMRPQLFTGKRLNIDSGVLRAFLAVPLYRHGARSMESLIAMSLLTGHSRYERSCLPAESQLNVHVAGRLFLAMVQQLEMTPEVLEQLAEAAHESYRAAVAGTKTRYGGMAYGELPENIKERNRDTVRDIPRKLACVDYIAIPARSNEPAFDFPGDDLERLSEMEHDRWMKSMVDEGFHYDARDRADNMESAAMLPWRRLNEEERERWRTADGHEVISIDELPEEQKVKDRKMVIDIPRILSRAGYTIVKTSGG